MWITLSAASLALVAAGYMGALVQLGTTGFGASTPRVIECAPAPAASKPAALASAPAQTAAPAQPEADVSAAPTSKPAPHAHARTKTASVAPHLAASSSSSASSSASRDRESQAGQPPVMTIRPLPESESPAPLSAATDARADRSDERPSRDEVMRGLAGLRSQLVTCAAGRHGVIDTHVTIAPSGRVTYSLIGGDFVGTPQGSCMARALRLAKFAPFSGPSLKVLFPYSL
jgi:hypothetical protein